VATKLSLKAMDELSMVYKHKDGQEWGPRNPEARVLAVKGGKAAEQQTGEKPKPGWFEKAVTAIKALGKKPEEVLKSWYTDGPVVGDVPDNIDGDGDGASDYNTIVALVTSMGYDLSNACWIQDDDGRSAAVVAIIDNFLEELDKIRTGDSTGKAGKRHNAADQASIDAANDAHGKLTKALAKAVDHAQAIGEAITALGSSKSTVDQGDVAPDDQSDDEKAKAAAAKAEALGALVAWTPGDVGEDGLPANFADFLALRTKAGKSDDDDKKSKEPYGDVEYADPGYQEDGKKRYPIDTKEHAKAAWSYINKESNASKYSSDDLAKVKSKIKAACEKFGVEISDDSSKSGEVEVTQEQIDALVAQAAETAATKAAETVKASMQSEIDAANEKATKAAEAAAAAQAEAEKAKADAEAAEAKLNGNARKGSQSSGGSDDGIKGRQYPKLEAALKAMNSQHSTTQPMGRDIAPQAS